MYLGWTDGWYLFFFAIPSSSSFLFSSSLSFFLSLSFLPTRWRLFWHSNNNLHIHTYVLPNDWLHSAPTVRKRLTEWRWDVNDGRKNAISSSIRVDWPEKLRRVRFVERMYVWMDATRFYWNDWLTEEWVSDGRLARQMAVVVYESTPLNKCVKWIPFPSFLPSSWIPSPSHSILVSNTTHRRWRSETENASIRQIADIERFCAICPRCTVTSRLNANISFSLRYESKVVQ